MQLARGSERSGLAAVVGRGCRHGAFSPTTLGCQRVARQTGTPPIVRKRRPHDARKMLVTGIKSYYRRYLLHGSHGPPSGQTSKIDPRHRPAAGPPGLPASCCSPIWSAISSTMRSAISRWRRLPTASTSTPCSGNSSRSRSCSTPPCLVHSGLGIWALYQRRQFRWKAIEPLQLVLGLSVPALVSAHVVGVRLGQPLFGSREALSAGALSCSGRGAVPDHG